MEDSLDSGVEYEIVDDEEEHEELGGLAFEPEIVDPIPEQSGSLPGPEPMDMRLGGWAALGGLAAVSSQIGGRFVDGNQRRGEHSVFDLR
ncbi:hypothetical protein NL676_038667 [Syzygium grande]|nr:hypothetical protein NL676_038667 [Syzygium grande]